MSRKEAASLYNIRSVNARNGVIVARSVFGVRNRVLVANRTKIGNSVMVTKRIMAGNVTIITNRVQLRNNVNVVKIIKARNIFIIKFFRTILLILAMQILTYVIHF